MSLTAEQLVCEADGFIERTELRIERLRFHIAHLRRQDRDLEGAQRILDRAKRQLKRLMLYRTTLVAAPGLLPYIPPEVSHARRFALT